MGSAQFFGFATIGYIVAMMFYISYLVFKNKTIGIIATTITVVSFVSHTAAFILRWIESYSLGMGRAPLTNLFESLTFFVWCLILGYLIIEVTYKTRSFGAFITPIAGMALGFIELSGISKEIEPIMPALHSNWLLAHVMMSFISYSAFALSFATALMYLILKTKDKKEPFYIFWVIAGGGFMIVLFAMAIDFIQFKLVEGSSGDLTNFLFKATFRSDRTLISITSWLVSIAVLTGIWQYGYILRNAITYFNISEKVLEDLTYKTITIGFPIFTLGGLIFGAVWADQAWGVYWSWDPKETWSLITWLIYALFLHTRYIAGWRGKRIAAVATVGFIAVIFTYLGVNMFLSGLHSYGGMQ